MEEEKKPHAALLEAVRAELRELTQGPDLAAKLPLIATVAARAQQLLLSLRVDPAMMLDTGGAQNLQAAFNGVPASNFSLSIPAALPAAAQPEQFGASAIRQVIALLPDLLAARHRDPQSLVEAIATAREKGMDDLAAKLERQLIIALPEDEGAADPAPPAPPSLALNGAPS